MIDAAPDASAGKAKIFTRSISISASLGLLIFAAFIYLYAEHALEYYGFYNENSGRFGHPGQHAWAALITILSLSLHYVMFRIPITAAVIVAASAQMTLEGLADIAPDLAVTHSSVIILVIGLAAFTMGIGLDLSDIRRSTRRSDTAFWLHMLAVPMILHSVITNVVDRMGFPFLEGSNWIFAILFALTVIAVTIDRRVMLMSGLIYVGSSSATPIRQMGFGDYTVLKTLLVQCIFILLLTIGWRPLRAAFLKQLPINLARRLPHPILSSS